MISLNNRLTTVSRFLKQGTIADIGSDHAYLPIYAIKTIYANAVLLEKLFKALSSCCENVAANQLVDRIDVRLGHG